LIYYKLLDGFLVKSQFIHEMCRQLPFLRELMVKCVKFIFISFKCDFVKE